MAMSNHHAYQLYAHITWHTWKRAGCLNQAAASDVASAMASACRTSGVRVLRSAVLADHVHVLVSFRPDSRLSDFIRLTKSVAALRASRRVPGAVRWARGFYAASVHRRDLARIVSYIARQHQHHPDRIPRPSRTSPTDPGRRPGVGGSQGPTDPGRQPGAARDRGPLTPRASPGLRGTGPTDPGRQPGAARDRGPLTPGASPGLRGTGPTDPGRQPGVARDRGPTDPGRQPGAARDQPH